MSKNINQVFMTNPIISNASTDLMYFGQSPYGATDDAAMTYANFSLQFLAANPTAHGVLIGEGTNTVHSVVLTAGEVLIGTTASDPVGATLTAGTNIGITSASGSITINATGSASFSWNDVSSGTQALSVNQGYVTDNGASLVTYTLPGVAPLGSIIEIAGKSSGGWTITYGSGQIIHMGNETTTVTSGSLSSTNQYDYVKLLCITANTTFSVIGGIGNLTIV
jgi:hypothetical protein